MTLSKVEAIAGLQASHRAFMSRFEALSPDEMAAPLPVITGLVADHHTFVRPLQVAGPDGRTVTVLTGNWRAHDLAAHVSSWDPLLAQDILALLDGHIPPWLAWDDAKAIEVNDQLVRERVGWPIERLCAELRDGRAALIDTLSGLSDAQFATSHRATHDSEGEIDVSPAWLCETWIAHDRAHAADLPAARATVQ